MSFSPPEGQGPLRRERLRTARLYFVCDARPHGADPEPLLRAALGRGRDEDYVDYFIRVKRDEWARYHEQVTPWEIKEYLTRF